MVIHSESGGAFRSAAAHRRSQSSSWETVNFRIHLHRFWWKAMVLEPSSKTKHFHPSMIWCAGKDLRDMEPSSYSTVLNKQNQLLNQHGLWTIYRLSPFTDPVLLQAGWFCISSHVIDECWNYLINRSPKNISHGISFLVEATFLCACNCNSSAFSSCGEVSPPNVFRTQWVHRLWVCFLS